jgi:hypothetical protein
MIRVALAGVFALTLLWIGTAQALAVPPSVTGESVSGISANSATLEADIDPGSAPAGAYFQFQLAEAPGELADEILCPSPNPEPSIPCIGTTSASALPVEGIGHVEGSVHVTLDLQAAGASLEPGHTYYFRVVAAPAKQTEDTIEWEEPTVAGETRSFTAHGPSAVITSESASKITPTDATLEAEIDPGEASYYQFEIAESEGAVSAEMTCPPPPVLGLPACVGPQSGSALPIGDIPQAEGSATVALSLSAAGMTLKPSTTYYFRVTAAVAKQTEDSVEWETPVVAGEVRSFTTPCPETSGPVQEQQSGGGNSQGTDPPPTVIRHHHRRGQHRRHHARHRHGLMAVALARVAR